MEAKNSHFVSAAERGISGELRQGANPRAGHPPGISLGSLQNSSDVFSSFVNGMQRAGVLDINQVVPSLMGGVFTYNARVRKPMIGPFKRQTPANMAKAGHQYGLWAAGIQAAVSALDNYEKYHVGDISAVGAVLDTTFDAGWTYVGLRALASGLRRLLPKGHKLVKHPLGKISVVMAGTAASYGMNWCGQKVWGHFVVPEFRRERLSD